MYYDLQIPSPAGSGTMSGKQGGQLSQPTAGPQAVAFRQSMEMAFFAGVQLVAIMTEMPSPLPTKQTMQPPALDLSFLEKHRPPHLDPLIQENNTDQTSGEGKTASTSASPSVQPTSTAASKSGAVPTELALWASVNRPLKANDPSPLLHVLHRLHNPCTHATQLQTINQTFPAFHLISAAPQNQQQFHQACSSWELDLITLDVSTRLPFPIKHTSVSCALQRGIYFEISIGKALVDAVARRNTIAAARDLVRVSKGKNIIFTSGPSGWRGRGVADIINFASLFGLKEQQAKDALTRNPRACILHGQTRRATYKSVCSTYIPTETLKTTQPAAIAAENPKQLKRQREGTEMAGGPPTKSQQQPQPAQPPPLKKRPKPKKED